MSFLSIPLFELKGTSGQLKITKRKLKTGNKGGGCVQKVRTLRKYFGLRNFNFTLPERNENTKTDTLKPVKKVRGGAKNKHTSKVESRKQRNFYNFYVT